MMGKKWLWIVIFGVLLSGCSRFRPMPDISAHVARSIDIRCGGCDDLESRYYDSDEKMEKILLYIRALKPLSGGEPEMGEGRWVQITVTRNDGSRKVFRQREDGFFQAEGGAWQKISAEQGSLLWEILRNTPSDGSGKESAKS